MLPDDRCVLDASVAIALVLPDEERGDSARRLVAWLGDGQVVEPGHWRAEIGKALLMAIRHDRLQPTRCRRRWRTLPHCRNGSIGLGRTRLGRRRWSRR